MKREDDPHRYDDIIYHERPQLSHLRMPLIKRAAIFAPFAALSGYEEEVAEAERSTEERIELDAYEIEKLNRRLQIIQENVSDHPDISVTYFIPDRRKSGGEYVTKVGDVRKIDDFNRLLILSDGTKIPFSEIIEISGELFKYSED